MRKRFLVLLAALATAACGHPETPSNAIAHTTLAAALPGPHVEGALTAKTLPALRDSVVTARLTIDSHVDANTPRPALNVALCIDTSGSMEGKAIDDARKAALSFVGGLKPGDGFSLVTFDSTVNVVVPPTHLSGDTDLGAIRTAIGAIRARGTTDMIDGLRTAIQEVRALYDATRVNRVVLVSDGVPNDATQLRAVVQQAQASGISISSMGLGIDYDEVLMGDLATTGGGRFKYIDDSSKIASYLGDELTRISRVSARSASLQIQPGPGVVVESVIGLASSPSGNGGVTVYLGDISLGSHRDVFFKLRVHGRRDGAVVELADANVRYIGTDNTSHDERFFFGAHASVDEDAIAKSHDDGVERAAKEAQQAADALETIRRAHESDKVPSNVIKRSQLGPLPTSPTPVAPEAAKRDHAAAMKAVYGDD